MELPSLTISNVEDLTLLEIDERLEYILGRKQDKEKDRLKSLSCLIYYGTAYGVATTKSKKNIEKQFHNTIDRLLHINQKQTENPENDIEANLKNAFRG